MDSFPALTAFGDRGHHVLLLQQTLNQFGFGLREDGVFGETTEAAVKTFQANNGLVADGFVGKNTLRVLFQKTAQETPPRGVHAIFLKLGVRPKDAAIWAEPMESSMEWASIRSPNNRAGYLANVLHESMMLSATHENLNYSPAALRRQWPHRFTEEMANRFGRTANHPADQRAIASVAYGGRYGNRPYPSDDGWRYRGRGPIQLTFLDNYRAFAQDTGIDVVSNPDLVARPDIGATAAAWYWRTRGCDKLAEAEDLTGLCRKINGGLNGLTERNHLFYEIRRMSGA